jgi:hypothetical protein
MIADFVIYNLRNQNLREWSLRHSRATFINPLVIRDMVMPPIPPREKILQGTKQPHKIPAGLYRRFKRYFGFHALNQYYYTRLSFRDFNTDGIDIPGEDWDNLIVLDGCRYDLFEQYHSLSGTLEVKESRASQTREWVEANFLGRELGDIVYVTANPVFEWRRHWSDEPVDQIFHDVVNVWEREWNEKHGTVLPETTTEYALEAAEKYPNKRLLIHFMQPHYPFIDWELSGHIDKSYHTRNSKGENIWAQMENEEIEITPDELWDAYAQNLECAMDPVQELLDSLPGKTIVTADHGNMLGERAFPFPRTYWGHPGGMYVEELVKVPWLVSTNGSRKEIDTTQGSSHEIRSTAEEVSDRLRDLGYAP